MQYMWTCCTCIISAVELKLPIIESSEEQQAKLKKDYAGGLKKYSICYLMSVEEAKRIEDVAQRPSVHCGFDIDYVGSYKESRIKALKKMHNQKRFVI